MENNNQGKEGEQVQYNLSVMKIMQIGRLIEEADYYYLKYNFLKAFDRYKCIFMHIRNRITPKQSRKAKFIEQRFRMDRSDLKPNEIRKLKFHIYEKYSEFINELLKNIGMDMREKEDDSFKI